MGARRGRGRRGAWAKGGDAVSCRKRDERGAGANLVLACSGELLVLRVEIRAAAARRRRLLLLSATRRTCLPRCRRRRGSQRGGRDRSVRTWPAYFSTLADTKVCDTLCFQVLLDEWWCFLHLKIRRV